MTIIHAWVYDPTRPSFFRPKANEKSALFTLHCDRADDCDVYVKCSSCLLTTSLIPCKYGKKTKQTGMTRRAGKFSSQILDWKKKFADHLGNLSPLRAYNRVFKIADHWYLPYSHMAEGVWGRGSPLKSKWVSLSEMDADLMNWILTARPEAEFGGEIKAYQETEVPKFLDDMRINYPELWCLVSDEQKSRLQNIDYTGRKAILATCLPGKFGEWEWDGDRLVGQGGGLIPVKGRVEIIPNDGAFLKVTNNEVVGPDTRFAD